MKFKSAKQILHKNKWEIYKIGNVDVANHPQHRSQIKIITEKQGDDYLVKKVQLIYNDLKQQAILEVPTVRDAMEIIWLNEKPS